MKQWPGYAQGIGFFLLATRAIYRLPWSPYYWSNELKSTLVDCGLAPVLGVSCLYTNNYITLLFYVDDIIVLYPKKYEQQAWR
jgi:hypothetical protein